MNSLLWIAPLTILASLTLIRVIAAPYWIQKSRALEGLEEPSVTEYDDPKGYLDHLQDDPQALNDLTKLTNKAVGHTRKVGEAFQRRNDQRRRLSDAGKLDVSRALRLSGKAARDLGKYRKRLQRTRDRMDPVIQRVNENQRGLAVWIQSGSDENANGLGEYQQTVIEFREGVISALEGMNTLRTAIEGFRVNPMSQIMSKASREALVVMDRLIGDYESIDETCTTAIEQIGTVLLSQSTPDTPAAVREPTP
ncbi:MAG: hypothetical protein QF554_09860 [Dehalococcoidia bacterium]|nr:hypothetical protein [Dehalococcoidia bacterium]